MYSNGRSRECGEVALPITAVMQLAPSEALFPTTWHGADTSHLKETTDITHPSLPGDDILSGFAAISSKGALVE